MRSINKIIEAPIVNMGGVHLHQALPLRGIDQIDPFLLIHHWSDRLKGGQLQQNVGVGPHPHRGFAPVTFIFKGKLHHRDSMGANSVIEAGGTQWMNSGSGIVHSERPAKELAENGGDFEIIQFWVNAPAKHKMDPPNYQPLTPNETPVLKRDNDLIKVAVVAGEFEGQQGKIDTYSPLLALRFEADKGGKMNIPLPENYNVLLYQLDGELLINQTGKSTSKNMTWFNNDGKSIEIEAKETSRFILLAGESINEPVQSYGPFVMNNQREIIQAMQDFQAGKMGVLNETFD